MFLLDHGGRTCNLASHGRYGSPTTHDLAVKPRRGVIGARRGVFARMRQGRECVVSLVPDAVVVVVVVLAVLLRAVVVMVPAAAGHGGGVDSAAPRSTSSTTSCCSSSRAAEGGPPWSRPLRARAVVHEETSPQSRRASGIGERRHQRRTPSWAAPTCAIRRSERLGASHCQWDTGSEQIWPMRSNVEKLGPPREKCCFSKLRCACLSAAAVLVKPWLTAVCHQRSVT